MCSEPKQNKPQCYDCKELKDVFGNFVQCGELAKQGVHKFVDDFYWRGTGAPKDCPLIKRQ